MNDLSLNSQSATVILVLALVACSDATRNPRVSLGRLATSSVAQARGYQLSWGQPSLTMGRSNGTLANEDLRRSMSEFQMLQGSPGKPQILLVGGFPLPAWVVAVSVCLSASVLTVIGFVLQKKGANAPGDHWQIGDVVLSKEWISGFILIVCAGFPLDLLAYSLAPMSLTTPLSGVTVALNMALAPRLLGEVVQSWPDAAATGLIVGGTLITTASGAHEEPLYNSHRVWELLGNHLMRSCLCLLLSVISICIGIMMLRRGELAKSAQRRAGNPNVLEVLLPSIVAGGHKLALKAVGVLLRASAPGSEILAWSVMVVVPAAIQLNYLNRGLQLYPQTVFVPIYTALLVLLSTIIGAIFYQEHTALMAQPGWQTLFSLGVFWIVGGISLFAFREPEASESVVLPKA
eukprot:CAMPEP_0115317224 /NCGR_PEP_ID=MMETSP0270-20121206/78543_1 /TAXON_ID=71861 /ORGANISM="Scrippsiella trochoidea, Strain CCMP3099" /LENGTH=404 /DNA_ID=CAMNT_0002736685 /DNA_START=73 /DNA_END=1285 /DNA_ORIENTATION=-